MGGHLQKVTLGTRYEYWVF